MNVEIGAEAALFPEEEYIKGIFVVVQLLAIRYLIANCAVRRTPLRLRHRTSISKCKMKKFCINCQLRYKLYLMLLLVKAAINARHICKFGKDCLSCIGNGAMVLTKRLHFFIF
jgi:hypothetical protein